MKIEAIEVLTALLVLITAFYAYVTLRMAKASERSVQAVLDQSAASLRPYITIRPFLEPGKAIYWMSISNTGRSAAVNLRMAIDRDFYMFNSEEERRNLARTPLFTESLASFAPGQEVTFGLGSGAQFFQGDGDASRMPKQFTITSEYESAGRTYFEVTKIDIDKYRGISLYAPPEVSELVKQRKAVEQMGKTLKVIAASRSS